ncbi:hypothetical protein E2C01_059516 [Portunus trituberculatus]|uniref:Uncharacterized protein n=1 Tax=Portunus trituberculatus TaxID=210409 RepID=A0A5B7H5K0_PORTR|nr:hypothetical protein [Portunus trituberculatus]
MAANCRQEVAMVGQMVLPVPGVIERGGHPRHSEYNLNHPVGPCPDATRFPGTTAPPCPEASLDQRPLTGRLQHCLQRPRGGVRDAPLVSSAAQECCRHRQLFGSVQMPRRFQQKGRLRSSVQRVPFRSLRQPWLQHTLLRLADFVT